MEYLLNESVVFEGWLSVSENYQALKDSIVDNAWHYIILLFEIYIILDLE